MFGIENTGSDALGTKFILTDVGQNRAESTMNVTQTAVNHFNRFLVYIDFHHLTFDEMESDDFTQDLIGRFAHYLHKVAKIKSAGSLLDYVSAVKTKCLKVWSLNTNMKDTVWYTNTRSNIKKLFLVAKAEEEESNEISEEAKKKEHLGTSMPEDHHSYIGNVLFGTGTRQSLNDRCLFAINWPCIGK
jgi:hypothetical protein